MTRVMRLGRESEAQIKEDVAEGGAQKESLV